MRKLIVATAFLGFLSAASALAQTPPTQGEPPKAQPPKGGMMMGEKMMGTEDGCPMMKKMASLEERVKKLEQAPPKQ
jgi:hypothetical protein